MAERKTTEKPTTKRNEATVRRTTKPALEQLEDTSPPPSNDDQSEDYTPPTAPNADQG
jgi:hypothetical protein